MDWAQDFSTFEGDEIDLRGIDANIYASGDQAFRFIGNAPGEINYVFPWGTSSELPNDNVAVKKTKREATRLLINGQIKYPDE
jgi:hypothetical protein